MPVSDFYNFKAKVFLVACLVFISGIALASFLPLKLLQFTIWWFGAAIFFLIFTILFWRDARPGLKHASLYFLWAGILFFSIWRYSSALPAKTPDRIWHYNGATVVVRGIIINEPDIRETSQKLEIKVETIYSPESSPDKFNSTAGPSGLKVTGKLLATTALYPEYKYGDELVLVCELKQPEAFNGFAYDRYLARYDIYSVCYYPKIYLASPSPSKGEGIIPALALPLTKGEIKRGLGRRNLLYAKIFAFKKIMSGLIDSGLSEPESSLARPIVFGGQRGLPQSIRDDFQKVGLTHIMAVSGFNISILAAIVMTALLALGFSRRRAFYLAVIFLAGYIILVGAPASAMRAGLMGFLVLWALKLGRLNKMTNSLILVATILLLLKPKLLRDDVGFQLSFLAIAGLVYAYPIFAALRAKIKLPKLKGVSDALLITLAAQVFTLPILAYNFSQVSLIAPLANLAVLWAVPLLTILILIALPLSFFLPALSFIFFLPSLILTKYILAMVKFFASWPHSFLTINYLWPGWLVLYYVLVIFIIIKARRSKLLKEELSDKI